MGLLVIHGESAFELERLDEEDFTLAYLDPPFFTGRNFAAFSDEWHSLDEYLQTVSRVALRSWRLLAPGGSLVVHCDHHASHHLKVILDGYFKRENFASEIVWRYRRWPSKQQNFQRVHDTLLRWVNPGGAPTWNQIYEPVSPGTAKRHGTIRQRKSNRAPHRWNQLYEPPSASTVATWGTKRQRAVSSGGKRIKSEATNEESQGVPMGDVWDISIIAPSSKERTGYPTQKPEKLLERLILATTNEGDSVLDPYCGSGTTAAVCHRLGRNCTTIDRSKEAIKIAKKRLGKAAKVRRGL